MYLYIFLLLEPHYSYFADSDPKSCRPTRMNRIGQVSTYTPLMFNEKNNGFISYISDLTDASNNFLYLVTQRK